MDGAAQSPHHVESRARFNLRVVMKGFRTSDTDPLCSSIAIFLCNILIREGSFHKLPKILEFVVCGAAGTAIDC